MDVLQAQLCLLGEFRLFLEGEYVGLPLGAQHLLAALALSGVVISRCRLAGVLWPEKGDGRAGANLRSSLWRVGQVCPELVSCPDGALQLAPSVSVDVMEMELQSRRLLNGDDSLDDSALTVDLLLSDLLPDWYEDWVVIKREALRQLRLHALEALCEHLTAAGRFAEAIEAGLAAISAEPLRESAHVALMRAYEAEGNWCEVRRAYENLRHLLSDELAIAPSARVEDLLHRVP